MKRWSMRVGDCRERMRECGDGVFTAIVTDPPYGLEFMGKDWDKFGGGRTSKPGIGERSTAWVSNRGWNEVRCESCGLLIGHGGSPCQCAAPRPKRNLERWVAYQEQMRVVFAECLRVLRPGGHALVFGGTRTHHRLACAMEDAGFEIRDCLMWLYGSGFPKSLNVSKAIDKFGGDPGLLRDVAQVLRTAREIRGMSVRDCDAHFCGSSSAWLFYEGRMLNGRVVIQIPNEKRVEQIIAEWPETADVFKRLRKRGVFKGMKRHARGGGVEDFGKVVGSAAVAREVAEFDHGTDQARQWAGYGTALKPAWEPILLARKPLIGTVAANALEHQGGGLRTSFWMKRPPNGSVKPPGSSTAPRRLDPSAAGVTIIRRSSLWNLCAGS